MSSLKTLHPSTKGGPAFGEKRYTLYPKELPQTPGVYLYKDSAGEIIYVGKAGNLRRRVSSYFRAYHKDSRISELVKTIAKIEIRKTQTIIEALILEAELIKKCQPKFNVREKDNTSFLYVAFTKEEFPKPVLVRGKELETLYPQPYTLYPQKIFGPFVNARSIRAALHILRRIFPYSTCLQSSSRVRRGGRGDLYKRLLRRPDDVGTSRDDKGAKPCFNYQIGLCPGVCIGAISKQDYARNMRNLVLFFQGKKQQILRELKKQMKTAAKAENFEEAGKLRNQIFALEHIRDTALIARDQVRLQHHQSLRAQRSRAKGRSASGGQSLIFYKDRHARPAERDSSRDDGGAINIFGRIEGYDISNISGTSAVGSMVVFQDGEASKNEYRKFRIKTVKGPNDVAMMREVLKRRFSTRHDMPRSNDNLNILRAESAAADGVEKHGWPLPDLIVIDGGLGQVHVAREVLRRYNLNIPVIGIAKGFMRKQDRPVYDHENQELNRIVENYKDLLLQVRDESHRFAISYHRKVRSRNTLI